MYTKYILRHIVPILTALTLVGSAYGPVQAADSIAEIMAEKGGRFGMCATDSKHDYYYYVTRAILQKNPTAKFAKLSGTAFEGSKDLDTAGRWYAAKRYLFSEDLDLIIIQLGDNVNDNEKKAAFGNNIRQLLAQIKADCPKARVICV